MYFSVYFDFNIKSSIFIDKAKNYINRFLETINVN